MSLKRSSISCDHIFRIFSSPFFTSLSFYCSSAVVSEEISREAPADLRSPQFHHFSSTFMDLSLDIIYNFRIINANNCAYLDRKYLRRSFSPVLYLLATLRNPPSPQRPQDTDQRQYIINQATVNPRRVEWNYPISCLVQLLHPISTTSTIPLRNGHSTSTGPGTQ